MNPAWSCSAGPGIARTEFTIADAARAFTGAYAAADTTDTGSTSTGGDTGTFMTQHIGKWHLGDFWNKKDPSNPGGFANPGNMGFEEWHSTEAQTSTSVPNCGCFPPRGWTPPNPAPVFPYVPALGPPP